MKKFNFSQDTVPTVDTINTLSKPHKGELQLLICYINHEAPKNPYTKRRYRAQ